MRSTDRVRIVAAGLLAGMTLALPALALSATPASTTATGQCLAWLGSRDDGQCIGYSSGQGTSIGTPNLGIWGPGYGNGVGVVTGPLLPGQTINQGLSP